MWCVTSRFININKVGEVNIYTCLQIHLYPHKPPHHHCHQHTRLWTIITTCWPNHWQCYQQYPTKQSLMVQLSHNRKLITDQILLSFTKRWWCYFFDAMSWERVKSGNRRSRPQGKIGLSSFPHVIREPQGEGHPVLTVPDFLVIWVKKKRKVNISPKTIDCFNVWLGWLLYCTAKCKHKQDTFVSRWRE